MLKEDYEQVRFPFVNYSVERRFKRRRKRDLERERNRDKLRERERGTKCVSRKTSR
jgi:hypothetical protein